jgi:hypothetical protein
VSDPDWNELAEAVAELQQLVGTANRPKARWQELRRHLGWGEGQDLHDIVDHDWPSVRKSVQGWLYSEFDPLPTSVEDLGTLASAKPQGQVRPELRWNSLDDGAFERLLYELLLDAPDYDNVQWPMEPNAPDSGRDISAEHVVGNSLGLSTRERIIVQCKAWNKKSISPQIISDHLVSISSWEPPPVNVFVIATTGKFTESAVKWVEKHNNAGKRPRVEMWPNNHLETLLAPRAYLVGEFNLRLEE